MAVDFETIVVGAGCLGSATAYWLAKLGQRDVLVLEQFELGHGRGSSEDHSRIIRHAYHSDNYGRLTQATYDNWAALEEESGLSLVVKTGGLDLATEGTAGWEEAENYRQTLSNNGHDFEDLTAAQIRRRWPQWQVDDDVQGIFQAESGILDIRRATAAHISLARARGVTFNPHEQVLALEPSQSGVTVTTNRATYTADHVVLCAASWSEQLLRPLGVDWTITLSQEQVSYFATPNLREFAPDRFPIFVWHGEPLFYGFPIYGEVGVKVGRDMTGRFVTQETRSFEPDAGETELLAAFLRDRIPGALGPELLSKTCVYDMPPDRDFILGPVPGHPQVLVGIGAGHAAKFAGLVGEILADLTVRGQSPHPIEAFSPDRPALTDPTFVPAFRMKD